MKRSTYHLIAVLCIGLILGMLLGQWVGEVLEANRWKQEALNRGHAHYWADTSARRIEELEFRWNESCRDVPPYDDVVSPWEGGPRPN